MTFDRRTVAARGDIAAAHLKGLVAAQKFVEGELRDVRGAFAPLRAEPDANSGLDSMLLHGEQFNVFEDRGGWCWGQSASDGYVGYAPSAALSGNLRRRDHQVWALSTHLYPRANIKVEPVACLYMTSYVMTTGRSGAFLRLEGGLYAPAAHFCAAGSHAFDFVDVAEMFLGAPYLWGGKTIAGLDCSGLVQVAMARAGLEAPRDSDMQEAEIGAPIDPAGSMRRGDLVFWPGHVGVMADSETLLHANAHHMTVAREPLREAVARIGAAEDGGPVRAARRPAALSAINALALATKS